MRQCQLPLERDHDLAAVQKTATDDEAVSGDACCQWRSVLLWDPGRYKNPKGALDAPPRTQQMPYLQPNN